MQVRFIISVVTACLLAIPVHAQLFRVPAATGQTVVRSTMAELDVCHMLGGDLARQVYAAVRAGFSQNKNFFEAVTPGLVQIKFPNADEVTGSGFLFEKDGEVFVAMAYHIGLMAGTERKVVVFNDQGEPHEYLVQIAASGQAGWHAPDISIAPLPREALLHGARPLTLGRADSNKPVFAVGYTSGFLQLSDFLPLSGELLPQEGYGLRIKRQLIAGEDAAEPFLFSGYCGSPVLQQQGNGWNVVGMHVGSCVVPGAPAENKAFAVNLDKVIPQLLNFYRNRVLPAPRELRFNNQPVDNLTYTEQVRVVTVWRNNEAVFEQQLRNYPGIYTDERSELALDGFEVMSGDVVIYEIAIGHRQTRQVQFTIP